ncbi:MAG: B12-binding domain-containing radical SAM protein [bacterium]
MTCYPPVGILSMSAVLKKNYYSVSYIDADILRLSVEDVVDKLKNTPPICLGVTVNVSHVKFIDRYINRIQEEIPDLVIIIGGPYITSKKDSIFDDFPNIKYAVIGEGEYAILDFMQFLDNKLPIDKVRNLVYQDSDKHVKINKVERIEDLDILPLPDYTLIEDIIHLYTAPDPSIALPSIEIMCSRGCPYNCTFCSSPISWGRKTTFRSVDSIIEEIKYLKKTINVKEIFFQDDTFNLNHKWFYKLCNKIIEEGLNKDIFYKTPFRLNKNLLNLDILKLAKKANFWMIFYGVESGNEEMLKNMNKSLTVKEIKRGFKLTRQAGLASLASFMIGNIGETKKTVNDSIDLIKKIKPDYGGFAITAPFPGTKLYDYAKEKNLILNDNFKEYQFGDSILRTEKLSKDDILKLHSKAEEEFRKWQNSILYKILSKRQDFRKFFDTGFYGYEYWDNKLLRRTGKTIIKYFKIDKNYKNIIIKVLVDHPDLEEKPVNMTIRIDNKIADEVFWDKPIWREIIIDLPDLFASLRLLKLEIYVDRTWIPNKFNANSNDYRNLGMVIEKIELA